jgi:hypothetical protein
MQTEAQIGSTACFWHRKEGKIRTKRRGITIEVNKAINATKEPPIKNLIFKHPPRLLNLQVRKP